MENFSISILDLFLVSISLSFAFRNLFKGVIKSLFSFIGMNGAYLVGILYHEMLALRLAAYLGHPSWLYLAGFTILFLVVLALFTLIELTLIQVFTIASGNREMGGLFSFSIGLLEGFLFSSAILWVLHHQDLPLPKSMFQSSILSSYYLEYNPFLILLNNPPY